MPTVEQWLPNWRRTRRKAENYTNAQDEARLTNHIVPRFGETKLDAIGAADVQAWVNELTASRMSPSTVQKLKSGPGVDVDQVKALMGHASIETTMRYAWLGEGGWDAVRSALS